MLEHELITSSKSLLNVTLSVVFLIKDFKLFETFIFSGYSIILGSGDHQSRSSSDSNQGKIPFLYA